MCHIIFFLPRLVLVQSVTISWLGCHQKYSSSQVGVAVDRSHSTRWGWGWGWGKCVLCPQWGLFHPIKRLPNVIVHISHHPTKTLFVGWRPVAEKTTECFLHCNISQVSHWISVLLSFLETFPHQLCNAVMFLQRKEQNKEWRITAQRVRPKQNHK